MLIDVLLESLAEADGEGGNADYYLITGAADDEDFSTEVLFGEDDVYYWQTEEYTRWTQSVRESAQIRDRLDGYYSQVLPPSGFPSPWSLPRSSS